jgi:hypothetical protein
MVLNLRAPLLDLLSVGKDKVLIDHRSSGSVRRRRWGRLRLGAPSSPPRLLLCSGSVQGLASTRFGDAFYHCYCVTFFVYSLRIYDPLGAL